MSDTVAMALSSTLLLASIVLGAVEILDGAPYGAAPPTASERSTAADTATR